MHRKFGKPLVKLKSKEHKTTTATAKESDFDFPIHTFKDLSLMKIELEIENSLNKRINVEKKRVGNESRAAFVLNWIRAARFPFFLAGKISISNVLLKCFYKWL